MGKPTLNEADYKQAADELGVEVAAIKAVHSIEAPRGGFQDDGQPVILFERHKFSAATGGIYDKDYPDISNPKWGGYGLSSTQHARLQRAAKLNRDAALASTSWGMFQILGSNYKQAGFADLQSYVNAMFESEHAQLEAFVTYIKNDKRLLKALQAKAWATFARLYNGSAYRENAYDVKLAAAFKRFSTGA
jgi:hypothetical protein